MYESCSQQGLRHTFLLSDVSEAQRGRHKSLHILVEIPLWALQAKLLPCSNSLIKQSCLRRISTALSWRSFLVLSSCPRQADTTHPHPHPKRSIPCLCLPIAPCYFSESCIAVKCKFSFLSACHVMPQKMLPLCICPPTQTRKTSSTGHLISTKFLNSL